MIKLDRITQDPDQMNGQPCLRNLRLTVRRVIEIAALYPDRTERQAEFPELDDEDVAQALHYAALQLPDGISPSKPSVIRIREEGLKGSQIAEPLITANQTLIGKMLLKTISHKRC